MKERPILFTGAMVRALLDGSKTQTRRAVKIKPPLCNPPYYATGNVLTDLPRQPGAFMEFRYERQAADGASFLIDCPYGQPGDRLWVRETFCPMGDTQSPSSAWYRADREYPQVSKWKPSIFMPRWASRVTLEIVSVRVERLQDISSTDAEQEGVKCNMSAKGFVDRYRDLWERINGAGSWDVNPWVWVVEFRKVET
jgi:hypothetical protein